MQPLRRTRKARVVFVVLFGGKLGLNLVTMPAGACRLIGSYTGTIIRPTELVSLAKRGIIRALVSGRLGLSQPTEALPMLKD